jgi:methylenetetrahydrofolate dehydrogenase (NADP+) / methenyltetrahydrofolate cyclohydrolase
MATAAKVPAADGARQRPAIAPAGSDADGDRTVPAQLIDGKAVAAALLERVAAAVARLRADHGLQPGLAVVLVGDDPASQVYVRNKARQTVAAGMRSFEHVLPAATTQADLLELVRQLNRDAAVHGILVQLPLPAHIAEDEVIEAIDPAKDVDGFHPINVGRLSIGAQALVPCTPYGCSLLIRSVLPEPAGAHAVVLGRSNIVGKPMAQLLLAMHCTVTIAHSRTRDLPAVARSADILVAAVGRAQMVRGDWIKPGACVIDVGINRVPAAEAGKTRLVGDVAFEEAAEVAGSITPVPGGVGPMTIACLLRNTVVAACRARGIGIAADL